ncbi:MAG: hypothetical protein AABX75_02645 [Nanoarchaeota archaeon]
MAQLMQDQAPESDLDRLLDEAGRTRDFILAASNFYASIANELIETNAMQFAIIRRQGDGSIALQIIVPTRADAIKYIGADTYIKVIGQ